MVNLSYRKSLLKLTIALYKSAGKSNGYTIKKHISGGHKQRYKKIDFWRTFLWCIPATICNIEYDANRSSYIALIRYVNGILSYILAPQGLKKYDLIIATDRNIYSNGLTKHLWSIPIGSLIHNIELLPNNGGKYVRAAGTYAKILRKKNNYTHIQLKSGEIRMISSFSVATLGIVSNSLHKYLKLLKAGDNRHKGYKSIIRGVAMNPIDHPHGGDTSGGRPSVNIWGIYTKGIPTKKYKKNKFIIKQRNKK